MKCPNCGAIVAKTDKFCEYCGTKLEPAPAKKEPVAKPADEPVAKPAEAPVLNTVSEPQPFVAPEQAAAEPIQRHGFITFWLWFMLVVNVVVAIANFAQGKDITIIAGFLGLVNVAAAILLLFGKRLGFWMFLAMGCISCITGIIGESIPQALGAVAGVAILFGILQLQKNDQTYWSQLK